MSSNALFQVPTVAAWVFVSFLHFFASFLHLHAFFWLYTLYFFPRQVLGSAGIFYKRKPGTTDAWFNLLKCAWHMCTKLNKLLCQRQNAFIEKHVFLRNVWFWKRPPNGKKLSKYAIFFEVCYRSFLFLPFKSMRSGTVLTPECLSSWWVPLLSLLLLLQLCLTVGNGVLFFIFIFFFFFIIFFIFIVRGKMSDFFENF